MNRILKLGKQADISDADRYFPELISISMRSIASMIWGPVDSTNKLNRRGFSVYGTPSHGGAVVNGYYLTKAEVAYMANCGITPTMVNVWIAPSGKVISGANHEFSNRPRGIRTPYGSVKKQVPVFVFEEDCDLDVLLAATGTTACWWKESKLDRYEVSLVESLSMWHGKGFVINHADWVNTMSRPLVVVDKDANPRLYITVNPGQSVADALAAGWSPEKPVVRGENESDPDLSAEFEALPPEVQQVIEGFEDFDETYEHCRELDRRLNVIGWCCEWYLDAVPYGFKPLANDESKES